MLCTIPVRAFFLSIDLQHNLIYKSLDLKIRVYPDFRFA
ncbi:hypothetical protein LEP1GSC016_0220 [Leptospira borgpetersenii serovar Hardjo-bovis str. Sponselee]|uniref:Uncharacterized protein n=7 Tax=Leptospira borgpetersenii TaxID=174 RepID=M3HVK0_LEPBO|nr:hypothetical protein LBBP_01922 [Leptospira borgpetersenii serovar Ballum]EKP12985.1 hypothetical protein LEP1GSC128_3046 [Leptospira borgpetersenii str. 200801926]EKQ91850.1 hypothetical protein LEP1GSC101_3383 [Leptospira borgpetersenii str. UI 09149]EKR01855.1 hypothetical protein LEP1GSC121_3972 [Leptospira borgpetersenii serovar Castellonis str. 200801910]EMG02051.1 hypothetical protein LEP1GSC123_4378 [Leptospira borgpetersenii str. 200701203]EMJ83601.1 hypothetical protein LEP1GSC016